MPFLTISGLRPGIFQGLHRLRQQVGERPQQVHHALPCGAHRLVQALLLLRVLKQNIDNLLNILHKGLYICFNYS